MQNPEMHRLQEELTALQAVRPDDLDARVAADLDLVRLRLDYLANQAGITISTSPYLDFLERLRCPATPAMAASA